MISLMGFIRVMFLLDSGLRPRSNEQETELQELSNGENPPQPSSAWVNPRKEEGGTIWTVLKAHSRA